MKRTISRTVFYRRAFLGVLFLAVLAAVPGAAQERHSWFFDGSVLFFPEDNGNSSAPMPIQFSPGAGFGIPLAGPLRLEITVDMYFGVYGYDFALDRPVPRAWENRSAWVWGSILGIQAVYNWRPRSDITVRAFGGPAADLRLVLIAPDLAENPLNPMDEIRRENTAITEYFWSAGRWLYPVVGAGMDFDLNDRFRLGFDLRAWIPLYKLWTNENLPFAEGWRFGVGARITLR